MYSSQWGDYVPVAARRAQAQRELARLRKAGQKTSPVTIEGRKIATTFWGKAWCDNLESYQDYENRLPRGRSYVRNGSVVDLQIAKSSVTAMVMGSSMYRVSVKISPLPAARWSNLCRECAGGIDSLVELLQGRFSNSVMERLCRHESGLFPEPSEIQLSCSCPDYSDMCKHVAAALYGVGARLDRQPELLYRLRSVDETALVRGGDAALPFLERGSPENAVSGKTDLSALFGLDIATPDASRAGGGEVPAPAKPKARPRKADVSRAVVPKTARSTAKAAPARERAAKPATGSKTPRASGTMALSERAQTASGAKAALGRNSGAKGGVEPSGTRAARASR